MLFTGYVQDVLGASGVDFYHVEAKSLKARFEGYASGGQFSHRPEGDWKKSDSPSEQFLVAWSEMSAGSFFDSSSARRQSQRGVYRYYVRPAFLYRAEYLRVCVKKESLCCCLFEETEACGSGFDACEV